MNDTRTLILITAYFCILLLFQRVDIETLYETTTKQNDKIVSLQYENMQLKKEIQKLRQPELTEAVWEYNYLGDKK